MFMVALALGVALRMLHFSSEIGGPHTFRQSHVVSDIISLSRDSEGGPQLAALERYDYAWAPGQRLFDVPLYQLLAAKLKDATGLGALHAARVLSLISFVLTCFTLQRLARLLLTSQLASALAVLVYSLSALSIQWHAAPMPDNLAVLLSLLSLLTYVESRGVRSLAFAASLACAGLATLIKPPVQLPVAIALGLAALLAKRRGVLSDKKLWAHAAVTLLATCAFQLLAATLNRGTEKEESLAWFFGTFAQRLEPARWLSFARRFGSVFGHPLLFAPFAWGSYCLLIDSWRSRATEGQRYALCWLAGNTIAAVVFFNVYSIHNYYQLPLLPAYAILVAYGGERLLLSWPQLRTRLVHYWPVTLLAASAFVAHAVQFTFWLPTLNYDTNREHIAFGQRVRAVTAATDQLLLVMGQPVAGPEMAYYARRRGRVVAEQDRDLAPVREFAQRAGGTHYVAFTKDVDATGRAAWMSRACGFTFQRKSEDPPLYQLGTGARHQPGCD